MTATKAAPQDPPSWRERWIVWRNRRLADPRFQRWAAGFWPTRRIARTRARALFDLTAGFVYTQVLYACVRLALFDRLADGAQSLTTLAAESDLPVDEARRLLRAAASLGLLEALPRDRFALGPHGAALLGNPAVTAMVEHHDLLYADLADPLALLRARGQGTRLGDFWAYARAERPAGVADERVAAYTRLMSASQHLIAGEVLDAYPLARHRRLLDIGGGDGTFLSAVGARAPHLHLTLFDLPPVAARARARFDAAGMAERTATVGGSFFHDALPTGADIATLVRVLHDHDDDAVRRILAGAARALPEGGVLLVAEPMAGTRGAEPIGDAYFGFYLLAMGSGRARTPDELTTLLTEAGFRDIRPVRTRRPLMTELLQARAPGGRP